jgi:hypothetical protein
MVGSSQRQNKLVFAASLLSMQHWGVGSMSCNTSDNDRQDYQSGKIKPSMKNTQKLLNRFYSRYRQVKHIITCMIKIKRDIFCDNNLEKTIFKVFKCIYPYIIKHHYVQNSIWPIFCIIDNLRQNKLVFAASLLSMQHWGVGSMSCNTSDNDRQDFQFLSLIHKK